MHREGLVDERSSRVFVAIFISTVLSWWLHKFGIEKFIGVSSACVYPRVEVPFSESEIWEGYPEPINGGYALSKE